MSIDIKPRHIRVLRELPISEMTDEEILKAAVDRLKARSAMLVYHDGRGMIFMGRYRSIEGRLDLRQLQVAWEDTYGKLQRIEKMEE